MSKLAPNLFQRRFQDLMEIARANLPSLAPEWTDHNAHDPGITLMELLAWVAEAQLYSLSRVRRDERAAYAALLGIAPVGTRGAEGLIWSDRNDPDSPFVSFQRSIVIPADSPIHILGAENPTFRPACNLLRAPLLWAPGRIERLETRSPGCRPVEHTGVNARGDHFFLPFGESGGNRQTLVIHYKCTDEAGLFGVHRAQAKGARWPIGIRLARAPSSGDAPATLAEARCSPLTADLVIAGRRLEVPIVSDSTRGLQSTGALLLDLDGLEISPQRFSVELRSPEGFAQPPRVDRIEPGAIPILQGRVIERELHDARGWPGTIVRLRERGLRFAEGAEPVQVVGVEPAGATEWKPVDDLSQCGPDESVFELDAEAGELRFGNGVNGRIPPAESQLYVTYDVSNGDMGRVARHRCWKVTGFSGAFGVNLDPIARGAASSGWLEERREARRRVRNDRALISAADIAEAAKALPLLNVARAWVPERNHGTQAATPATNLGTNAITLVAMRARHEDQSPEQPTESARWLEAVRRRLAPRMPLGARLRVVAPRYARFSIEAVVETHPGNDPAAIEERVERELKKRLALVAADSRPPVRHPAVHSSAVRRPGAPVTGRDVAAWLQTTAGVRRIIDLRLRNAAGEIREEIAVSRGGLPDWDAGGSSIEVQRPAAKRPQ